MFELQKGKIFVQILKVASFGLFYIKNRVILNLLFSSCSQAVKWLT